MLGKRNGEFCVTVGPVTRMMTYYDTGLVA